MRIQRIQRENQNDVTFALLDDANQPIEAVSGFMLYLSARRCSPHTLSAYAYDLLHFMRFLALHNLSYEDFTPAQSLRFLEYLSEVPCKGHAQHLGLVLCTTEAGLSATRLSPSTINRIFAAVSAFYEYLILSEHITDKENPIQQVDDPAQAHVSERHKPFIGYASRQRPVRRVVRVKTARRLPRPMSDDEVNQILDSLRSWRDKAMIQLMLQGGLRPGEVLNLRLEDIQYGRRRVIIRYRTDHPKGVRTKSRTERYVDLHEPEALKVLSAYIMSERPSDTDSRFVFLVGGRGKNRHQPLSYHALVKMFARRCERLGIREPWKTPHSLRHTHATKMWEGGMRELALQKRLGHASPESTRIYTQVSDPAMVAEYNKALGGKQT
jgi:integrase